MKELNWNIFALKFNGKENIAFERMVYGLFCTRYNQPFGIFSFRNQAGIETEPIKTDNEIVGFQAKYYEPSVRLSSRKNDMINAIEKAVKSNRSIDRILFYINKSFGESKKLGQKKPKYILDIEARAEELNVIIEWQVPSHIQKQLSLSDNSSISQEFFPEFYEFKRLEELRSRNELLNITKTAIIQLEIEKIKQACEISSWDTRNKEIEKLYQFVDHSNEVIASSVIDFLQNISNQTRANMSTSVAYSLFSLVLDFFPSSYDSKEQNERLENGLRCVQIGFELIYDSLIHLGNYRIAQYGLNIWKYLYREGKRNSQPELTEAILKRYSELESTLFRPERNDLSDSRLLVQIFKEDLENYSLIFPVVPNRLYEKIRKCK